MLCDSTVLGVIVNELGEPLLVGRQHRLVIRAQRRALMVRDDGRCQYPGCQRRRHLKAHHRISWLNGGPTDLDNLILLCQSHHTQIHESHITVASCGDGSCATGWRFTRADGSPILPAISGSDAPYRPAQLDLATLAEQIRSKYGHVDHSDHRDAQKVFPLTGGAGFVLAECVDALFRIAPSDVGIVTAA